jgi:hypothetical protein
MIRPPKSLAQRLKDADDFDEVCGNAFWWDNYIAPHFGRRRRLALAGRVFMLKSVHDEMRHRDLLAKAHVAARARPAVVVLRGPRSGSQPLALVPTEDELRTAARRRATLALS